LHTFKPGKISIAEILFIGNQLFILTTIIPLVKQISLFLRIVHWW